MKIINELTLHDKAEIRKIIKKKKSKIIVQCCRKCNLACGIRTHLLLAGDLERLRPANCTLHMSSLRSHENP